MFFPLSLVGVNVSPARWGVLRCTARNCAVICLPIQSIEFPSFVSSGARDRSYIVLLQPLPLDPSLSRRDPATRPPSQPSIFPEPKPISPFIAQDGGFLS